MDNKEKLATLTRNVEALQTNALILRQQWLTALLDPRRNIDKECGHPDVMTSADYDYMYRRGDVASRVVSLYPEETWSQTPEVYETEDETETAFETAWKELNRKHHLPAYLLRADILSGIGRFGVLLLGFSDGQTLNVPVAEIPLDGTPAKTNLQLLYVRPLDETVVTVKELDRDTTSPRYGQPVLYEITYADTIAGSTTATTQTTAQLVHWTRIIHVADNRKNDEVFGMPRLEKVVNRLLDLKKIAGGSGEMFWKGGFPGLSLQSQTGLDPATLTLDKDATKEQLEAYQNGLQRYIATIGMDIKSLSVQVADPTPHCDLQMRLVAIAMGVPWRIFAGAELGELASSQDATAWDKRVTRRREDYVNPFLIRPFVDRLILFGVLPPPTENVGYQIYWPDLHTPSEEEKATVAEKRSNAIAKYVTAGADVLIPPFHFLTLILDMETEEADSIIEAAMQDAIDNPPDNVDEPPADPTAPPARRGAVNPARNNK